MVGSLTHQEGNLNDEHGLLLGTKFSTTTKKKLLYLSLTGNNDGIFKMKCWNVLEWRKLEFEDDEFRSWGGGNY